MVPSYQVRVDGAEALELDTRKVSVAIILRRKEGPSNASDGRLAWHLGKSSLRRRQLAVLTLKPRSNAGLFLWVVVRPRCMPTLPTYKAGDGQDFDLRHSRG